MGPEGLEPSLPQYFNHGLMQYISPQLTNVTMLINTNKVAALQQRRKITNSFNFSLDANDIAAPYLISCV